MTPADFEAYRHQAVHQLMDLNEECEKRFRIGHWERWDYDLDSATLTFSDGGVPQIIAQIQAVGSTSITSETWPWSWANESLPSCVTARIEEVREFGRNESVPQLTESKLPDPCPVRRVGRIFEWAAREIEQRDNLIRSLKVLPGFDALVCAMLAL